MREVIFAQRTGQDSTRNVRTAATHV